MVLIVVSEGVHFGMMTPNFASLMLSGRLHYELREISFRTVITKTMQDSI